MSRVILASQSPRRKELLKRVFDEFDVIPSGADETVDAECSADYVCTLACRKARDVASRVESDALVIGADTIVVCDGRILEKPKDEEDAFAMLTKLSGRAHQVYTGVALCKDGQVSVDYEMTDVWIRPLTPEEISRYIETGEPMDKAGAYGIQDKGALLVSRIEGDYFNVVGLPLCKLCEMLHLLGYTTL